jgi:hypothetical protein
MRYEIEREFDEADLGDSRLNARAARIVKQLSAAPAVSFPRAVGSDADLQGLYGFMENDALDHRALVDAHAGKTVERIRDLDQARVLVIHDTTTVVFPGELHREGLGWVTSTKQGFHAHFSLALSTDESRCPLGVLALSVHQPAKPAAKDLAQRKRSGKECSENPDRDTRWRDGVERSSERLRGIAIPIHVADRGADGYDFMGSMVARDDHFVIRANFDRRVTTADDDFVETTKVRSVAERTVPVTSREIQLSRRRSSPLPNSNKRHPPRGARLAKLEIAAGSVRIRRTKHLGAPLPEAIDVNFVHVREIGAPDGNAPVDWLLLTTEPVDTNESILRVVDYYRARWTIEELFKAIKSGCNYEHRQLESARALLVALALCIPIAWQMLALRHQSRHLPKRPATHVMDPDRLAVLVAISRIPLSASPTVEEVCYAVAALGGHIKRNGPPGWQTLRFGMDALLLAELGWKARAAVGPEM